MPAEGDPEQRVPRPFIPYLYPYIEVFSGSVNTVHFADLKSCAGALRERFGWLGWVLVGVTLFLL